MLFGLPRLLGHGSLRQFQGRKYLARPISVGLHAIAVNTVHGDVHTTALRMICLASDDLRGVVCCIERLL